MKTVALFACRSGNCSSSKTCLGGMVVVSKKNRQIMGCFLVLILALSPWSVTQSAQQPSQTPKPGSLSPDPVKVWDFGKVEWGDEMSRLDYFDNVLREQPKAIGYIIVFGGRRGDRHGEVIARMKCAEDYMVNRRLVDRTRIVAMNAGYRERFMAELWVSETGPPPISNTISRRAVRLKKGTIRNWRDLCNN